MGSEANEYHGITVFLLNVHEESMFRMYTSLPYKQIKLSIILILL